MIPIHLSISTTVPMGVSSDVLWIMAQLAVICSFFLLCGIGSLVIWIWQKEIKRINEKVVEAFVKIAEVVKSVSLLHDCTDRRFTELSLIAKESSVVREMLMKGQEEIKEKLRDMDAQREKGKEESMKRYEELNKRIDNIKIRGEI